MFSGILFPLSGKPEGILEAGIQDRIYPSCLLYSLGIRRRLVLQYFVIGDKIERAEYLSEKNKR